MDNVRKNNKKRYEGELKNGVFNGKGIHYRTNGKKTL